MYCTGSMVCIVRVVWYALYGYGVCIVRVVCYVLYGYGVCIVRVWCMYCTGMVCIVYGYMTYE